MEREEMARTILMDSRYSRIDPRDYSDEMLEVIYRRIMGEREQRLALMERIRAGESLDDVLDAPGGDFLRLTDIIEVLPGRTASIGEVMAYYGFVENCPIGYLPPEERKLVIEALTTGKPLKKGF